MAKHIIKLNGTSVPSFKVGLHGATISSEAVTSPYSLILPPTLGDEGQTLVIDSNGALVFKESGNVVNIPYISWIATAGQTVFTSSTLAEYPADTPLTVFRNGVLMMPSEYTIVNNTLTVATYVADGDDIEIPSRGISSMPTDVVKASRIKWTATQNQTVFTSSTLEIYPDAEQLTVFRNGVLMMDDEYTLTSSNTLTISTFVAEGDDIVIPSKVVLR